MAATTNRIGIGGRAGEIRIIGPNQPAGQFQPAALFAIERRWAGAGENDGDLTRHRLTRLQVIAAHVQGRFHRFAVADTQGGRGFGGLFLEGGQVVAQAFQLLGVDLVADELFDVRLALCHQRLAL